MIVSGRDPRTLNLLRLLIHGKLRLIMASVAVDIGIIGSTVRAGAGTSTSTRIRSGADTDAEAAQ
jgi:hypothetical protein